MKMMLLKLRSAPEQGSGWAARKRKIPLYGCLLLLLVGFAGGCGDSKEGRSSSSSGPPNDVLKTRTDDVIRTCMQRVLEQKQAQEFTEVNCKITNLQRGEPFTDPLLRDLPSGRKVFPVRLMVEGTVKQPDARAREILEKQLGAPTLMQPVEVKGQIELKLYQDAFGVWQARSVNSEELKFRVDQGQWEPAPQ